MKAAIALNLCVLEREGRGQRWSKKQVHLSHGRTMNCKDKEHGFNFLHALQRVKPAVRIVDG